jgi:GT2 family glycosyltransferase
MVIPAAHWLTVGPFDEGYFMYWEDADWCHRAHRIGLRVQFSPELLVEHHQGSSSAYRPLASIVAFHRSAWRYQRRQGSGGRPMLAAAAAGLTARAGAKVAWRVARGVPHGVATSARRLRLRLDAKS